MLSYHSLFCSFLLYVSVTGKAYEFFYPPPEKVENFPIWLSLLTFLSGKTFSYSMQYANALLLMYQNNKITYLNPFSEKWQRVFMDFFCGFSAYWKCELLWMIFCFLCLCFQQSWWYSTKSMWEYRIVCTDVLELSLLCSKTFIYLTVYYLH